MDFSTFGLTVGDIFAGILFGVIGLYYLRAGKKDADYRVLMIGLGMMVYPYFVSGALFNWGIGIALWYAAYAYRNNGQLF